MGGIFSSPKPSAPPPPTLPPPIPEKSAAEVRAAETETRKRAAAAKGRSSTILTGPTGLSDTNEAGGKKTLLGQ